VSRHRLLHDEQFGFRPKHSTALNLARLEERVSRNFDDRRLTGSLFLDVAKAFNTVWVDGLLYKLTILNFPSYLVNAISSYLNGWMFEVSFQTATSPSRRTRAGLAQGGIISPVLFSLYVNDTPPPSRHFELALYADDTAVIATFRQPVLLIKYLETYLCDLERWLSEWRITINVSKSSTMLFAKTDRRILKSQAVQLFGEPLQWVDDTHYLGVTLGKWLTWSKHIDQVRKKAA
jgi:hypothetical protein